MEAVIAWKASDSVPHLRMAVGLISVNSVGSLLSARVAQQAPRLA